MADYYPPPDPRDRWLIGSPYGLRIREDQRITDYSRPGGNLEVARSSKRQGSAEILSQTGSAGSGAPEPAAPSRPFVCTAWSTRPSARPSAPRPRRGTMPTRRPYAQTPGTSPRKSALWPRLRKRAKSRAAANLAARLEAATESPGYCDECWWWASPHRAVCQRCAKALCHWCQFQEHGVFYLLCGNCATEHGTGPRAACFGSPGRPRSATSSPSPWLDSAPRRPRVSSTHRASCSDANAAIAGFAHGAPGTTGLRHIASGARF